VTRPVFGIPSKERKNKRGGKAFDFTSGGNVKEHRKKKKSKHELPATGKKKRSPQKGGRGGEKRKSQFRSTITITPQRKKVYEGGRPQGGGRREKRKMFGEQPAKLRSPDFDIEKRSHKLSMVRGEEKRGRRCPPGGKEKKGRGSERKRRQRIRLLSQL